MAYYRGDYYRGHGRGDYYRGRRGDPFWGALWTGIKAVGGALLGARPAATAPIVQAAPSPAQTALATMSQGLAPGAGLIHRAPSMPTSMIPGSLRDAARSMRTPVERVDPLTGMGMRRRRMNPANPRALRRSIRRVVGFGRLAMRSRRAIGKAATALQCGPRRISRPFPARRRAS